MKRIRIQFLLASVIVLSTCLASCLAAVAQTGAPAQKKPGMLARMKQKLTGKKPESHAGQIIGNKNSKVYHLPGATGNLPAEKNRVYFKTEVEAKAAGFRAAGAKVEPPKKGPARDPKTGKFIKKA